MGYCTSTLCTSSLYARLFIIEFTVYGVALYRCIDDQLKASTIEFNSQKEQAQ
jgi:hypothetical protein